MIETNIKKPFSAVSIKKYTEIDKSAYSIFITACSTVSIFKVDFQSPAAERVMLVSMLFVHDFKWKNRIC